ncbi:hypothetical protein PR048_002511 [Dryococelus australis]|uniref:Uncharacterized protein n=1 Tax=Dryococelus australis TaxID=614101 RepID=A0ABQ9IKD9_9NEOP|nr:hypothetical protein PR048_002511 [Dryococelus australis]
MDKEHRRLKSQRAVYKGSLSRMQTFVSNYSEYQNSCKLKSRLGEVPTLWERFEEVQLILELDDDDTDHSEHRAEFETMFHRVKAHYLHLPAVNLPTFTGDFTTWVQFRDTFKGLIVDNKPLPDVQKLHYLISSLKYEAHELLHNLPISNDNFAEAWHFLNTRYNNTELIAAKYVTELLVPP